MCAFVIIAVCLFMELSKFGFILCKCLCKNATWIWKWISHMAEFAFKLTKWHRNFQIDNRTVFICQSQSNVLYLTDLNPTFSQIITVNTAAKRNRS